MYDYFICIMKINEDIKSALGKAIDKQDSQTKFAELCGIPQTNISKYRNGGIKVIREDCWEKLEPFIRPYLPQETKPGVAEERAAYHAAVPDLNDSLVTELLSIWSKLAKSERLRLLAIANDFLEETAQKHVERKAVG